MARSRALRYHSDILLIEMNTGQITIILHKILSRYAKIYNIQTNKKKLNG